MAEQTLGQMVVKLSLDSSAFGSGLAGAKKAATSAMSEMKASMKVAAATGDKIATLATKQQGLMKEIQAQAKIMNAAQKDYANSFDKTTGQATKSTAMYAKAYNDAVGKMAQFQSQAVKAAGQQAVLQTKTRGVTGAINTMGTKMTSASKTLSSFGSKATWGVTVPIVAAFAAAGKQALQFQNQLNTIKNLLITSGESGASAIKAVSQMQSQSVTLSNKYGVSVTKISQGYEDLVRRGYTGAQAVASMKTELQGALASGDDFNDVVKVASETIEAFGMRSNNTATQTKNTKTAVNELAYAADATATDFADLGLGMSYVGSSAHQAGFSLSETSAAMGILSNNGLSAQKAGTGLRKVVISLTTAVGKIDSKNSVLAKLGIKKAEMVDANGNLKNMSTIMGVLAKHTQGMSKTKKATVFNSLFGTTGQQAGIILTQNASALEKLNKQVEASVGKNYVGELSQKNLASAQNKLRIFMETAKNLGMVLAEDVLPTITPLMGDAAKLADKFAHLDPSVRKATVAFIAAAAAVGPLSSGLGIVTGVLGKTSTSLVSAIANVRKWSAEIKASGEATQAANGILGLFGGRVAKTAKNTKIADATVSDLAKALSGAAPVAGEAAAGLTETGAAAGAMGTGMTASVESGVALTGTLSALGLALGATVLAVGAGAVIWELWGKKVAESKERTKLWGSDIGKTAGTAASKMTEYERDVDIALDNNSDSASTNSKKIVKAFDSMTKSAKAASKAQTDAAKKLADSLGGAAGAALEKEAAREEKSRNTAISKMKAYAKQVESITKESRDKNVELTADQRTQINNLQMKMAEEQVKTLGVSAKQQRQILKAELGKTSTASAKELAAMAKTIGDASYQEQSNFQKKLQKINSAEGVSRKAKNAAIEAAEKEHSDKMTALGRGYINVAREQGESNKAILQDLTTQYGFTQSEAEAALSGIEKAAKASANGVAVSLSGLTDYALKAANDWNSIVLDPKTGKVKTNAQEEVNKALQSSEQWDNIELLIKEGKMSTNATAMVETGLIAQGRWNDALWVAKNAKLNDQTKAALISAMVSNGQWNATDYKTAELLAVNKSGKPVIQALQDLGQWDQLTPKQQQMIAQAKTKAALKAAVEDVGEWNALSPKLKRLLANADSVRKETKSGESVLYSYGRNNPGRKNLIAAFSDPGYGGTINALNTFGRTNPRNKNPKASYSSSGQYDVISGLTSFNAFLNQGSNVQIKRSVLYSKSGGTGLATGTNDFRGGLAIVNDQKGSTFREAISDPVLGDFIPSGRDVVLPLSRHAKVYKAALTKQMYPGLPQFASGLNVPASATPLQMAREVSQQAAVQSASTVVVASDNKSTDTRLDTLITLIAKLLDKDADLYMDSTKVGTLVYPAVKKAQARDQRATNRRGGYTN